MDCKQCVYVFTIVIVIGVLGFALGVIGVYKTADERYILIERYQEEYKVGQEVVVSKNGTVYYPWWCSSIKTINPENRVVYKNKKEAEENGYRETKRCKES